MLKNLTEYLDELAKVPIQSAESDEQEEYLNNRDISRAEALVNLSIKNEEYESKRQDRLQRGDFSYHIFSLLFLYIVSVMGIVIVVASGLAKLSDTVLCMLLGTTTANVIGIFNFVAKYLFHTKE